MAELDVTVEGSSIIVARPDSDMWVVYEKQLDSPDLVLTESWMKPTETAPQIAEFRAQAFQAAIEKARELGWIV